MRKEEGSTSPKEMKERQTSLETSDSNFKIKGKKHPKVPKIVWSQLKKKKKETYLESAWVTILM